MINIDEFLKIEMKIGKVISAEPVEGSAKLLKLIVDFSETDEAGVSKPRQVLSGIGKYVNPEELVGQIFPFVTNLPPRVMMGLESQAMILAASDENGLALLKPTYNVAVGTKLS